MGMKATSRYSKILVPCDNSRDSHLATRRAIELALRFDGEITGNHVYAARLHDIRFRQLETGLPAQYQTREQIRTQRAVHNKLIEKGLVLIGDSFLGQMESLCKTAGLRMTRQLLEGTHFQELIREANTGGYDLMVMGAQGIGRQPASQLGGVVSRTMRGVECDLFISRIDAPLEAGRYLVCVDGSAYSYRAMRVALELARAFGASLFVCSAFDGIFHHLVFDSIKGVLSREAAKVFKFEEQEELHDNIIDKGLLKLAQANLERALVLAEPYAEVEVVTQVLVGKPFQAVLDWSEEIDPTLIIAARHGAHRVEGSDLGSQAENLVRLARPDILLVGIKDVRADEIPWIEADGDTGLEWAPEAEVRMLRVPPFAQEIARRAVEEYVVEAYGTGDDLPTVTTERLDVAIRNILPSHMQLVMGIGTVEEIALAEVRAEDAMKRAVVQGHDEPEPARPLKRSDPIVWTKEAYERLQLVPLIARPLALRTVERFARREGLWRVTTRVMDENKESMIEADEFDAETMLVMFRELQSKQLTAQAQREAPLSGEMRRFIEEAKGTGVQRCPIRDLGERRHGSPAASD